MCLLIHFRNKMPAVDKEADKENTQTSPRQTENSDILYKRRNGTNSTARPRLHRRASSSQEIQLGQGKLGYDRQVSDGNTFFIYTFKKYCV